MSREPKGPAPAGTAPSLQADLERLEQIVRALEAEDLDLDEALSLFEEGVTRLKGARARLGDAEVRLKQLREAADGSADAVDIG